MKKQIYFYLLLLVITLFSCEKNDVTTQTLEQKEYKINDVNVFKSKQELEDIVYSSISTEKFNRRKSYIKTNLFKVKQSIGELISADSTEIQLEELVPNNNFRNILNDNGEFVVSDTIYRITPSGTFYTAIENRDELNSISVSDFDNAAYVEDKTKTIGNISLYETFSDTENQEEYAVTSTSDATSLSPNINAFPVKNASRWTVVGGWRDNVFGEDKWHYETIQEHRRLGANLYDYNYVGFKAAGFKAKVQHNNTWFGTWGIVNSWDRELTIGWKDMIFEIDMPGLSSISLPKNPIYTNHNLSYSQYIPNIDFEKFPFAVGDGGINFIIPLICTNVSFSYADLQKMVYLFAKKQLVSEINSLRAKGFVVDIPSQNKRYIYFTNSQKSVTGREISQEYFSSVEFVIKFGNQGDFWSYLGQSVAASQNMKYFRLVSGMAYAYTPNATGGYTGMIVKKFEN